MKRDCKYDLLYVNVITESPVLARWEAIPGKFIAPPRNLEDSLLLDGLVVQTLPEK